MNEKHLRALANELIGNAVASIAHHAIVELLPDGMTEQEINDAAGRINSLITNADVQVTFTGGGDR